MSQTQGGTLYGYRLRREQREALAYRGGRLAVSDLTRGIPFLHQKVSEASRRKKAEKLDVGLETAYCAETVAITYEEMGLLSTEKHYNWFDPGSPSVRAVLTGAMLASLVMAAALPLPKERPVVNPTGFTRRYGNTIQARIGVVRRDGLDACIYD